MLDCFALQKIENMHTTTCTQASATRCKRRRSTSTSTVVGALALILAANVSPGSCFHAFVPSTSEGTRLSTTVFFRNSNIQEGIDHAQVVTTTQWNSSPAGIATLSEPLPTWLAIPKAHLADENVEALKFEMKNSFFTESEVLRLVAAIEEASAGDLNKLAGAAEFCLLLIETMEMGLNALTAATFHFCSCWKAREVPMPLSLSTVDSTPFPPSLEACGEHCVALARDAGRLKQLELVAAYVMKNKGHRVRVSPDSKDAENLRKLLVSETKDWRALAIRSAACLYRLRGILTAGPAELTPEAVRTAREALLIFAPLASRLGMHRLKNELEGAAFQVLYRRQYERVTSLVNERRSNDHQTIGESMHELLDHVKGEVATVLQNDEEFSSLIEHVSVSARVKEPYSLWKKMLRHNNHHILQVPDALALRIVLKAKKLSPDEDSEVTRARERVLCYYAQKLCTDRWSPDEVKPRFKDYIENPKPNGYQSLHYTASIDWSDEEWNMEFQCRSEEMHMIAEYGLASHWDYKANAKKSKANSDSDVTVTIHSEEDEEDHSTAAYLRNLQQWHWQQHGGAKQKWDATPASYEPVVLTDIWQSRERSDRMRERTERLDPYLKALTEAQSELALEYVFVFLTPLEDSCEGRVLALPAGACVWDALRAGEESLGFPLREAGLALNGAETSVTRRLNNGDVLTIPMAANLSFAA